MNDIIILRIAITHLFILLCISEMYSYFLQGRPKKAYVLKPYDQLSRYGRYKRRKKERLQVQEQATEAISADSSPEHEGISIQVTKRPKFSTDVQGEILMNEEIDLQNDMPEAAMDRTAIEDGLLPQEPAAPHSDNVIGLFSG